MERLVEALRGVGLAARVAWTPKDRHLLVVDAGADPLCRCLVAVGGDGTVAGLINERPQAPMTVLRAGTENLFARHFGLSADPRAIAAMIARGQTLRIDLGRASDRRFALMAGLGFDADVVTRHHLSRLGPAGRVRPTHRAAYLGPGLSASLHYRFPPLTVTITDPGPEETLVGAMVFLFNLPCYALGLPIAPSAREDDGLLDLVVFRKPGFFHALRYLGLVYLGWHLRTRSVEHRRVRRVQVTAAEPAPVQLDGDPAGVVPTLGGGPSWTAEVLPRALEILVPQSYHPVGSTPGEKPGRTAWPQALVQSPEPAS